MHGILYSLWGRGLFELVTCPNYIFGELVEWVGW
jgi:hypothetical protein